ncbi:MAG TPA: hypothetical protein PKE12_07025 [Kiritimatiellia bacterium]|nr:hypothetical protein [Kiritimatiellia bacterium]
MTTVQEIEQAIEKLPADQYLELAEWFDERRFLLKSAESIFQMLDEEEDRGVRPTGTA